MLARLTRNSNLGTVGPDRASQDQAGEREGNRDTNLEKLCCPFLKGTALLADLPQNFYQAHSNLCSLCRAAGQGQASERLERGYNASASQQA